MQSCDRQASEAPRLAATERGHTVDTRPDDGEVGRRGD